LDTCIVIYRVEHHSTFAPIIKKRLATLAETDLVISPLVRLEALVKLMRDANQTLLQRYDSFLASLHTLLMPEEIYEIALSLRVKHNLKTPDALHIATAQCHHCQAVWTNDGRLAHAVGELAVNIRAESIN